MAAEQQPSIEVDQITGGDSDYETADNSETYSITSSLNTYLEQNGRRYHTYFGPDKNPMPNDDVEQDRLDLIHETTLLVCGGKTLLAPVQGRNDVQRVLDLGTGTGIWAIDYANENPHAEVLGIDLSHIQPSWVPPNCRFEIDDFELDWNFKKPFDYINARMITQSVNDWPRLLEQAKQHLRPGGWLEIGEYSFEPKSDDNTMPADWPPAIMFGYLRQALKQIGRISVNEQTLKSLLEDSGFVDVHVKTFKCPSGTWPKKPALKQAGAFFAASAETGYEAYMLALCTRVLGMDEAKVVEMCKKAEAAHHDRKAGVHAYWEYYSVYGRKPEEEA